MKVIYMHHAERDTKKENIGHPELRMLEDITWSADWQGRSFFKFLFYMLKFMRKYDIVEVNYCKK